MVFTHTVAASGREVEHRGYSIRGKAAPGQVEFSRRLGQIDAQLQLIVEFFTVVDHHIAAEPAVLVLEFCTLR